MSDLQKMDRIQEAISLLSEVYYKATINHLRVFLYIAARDGKVIETRDLPGALGMTQTTINRTMRSMADRSYIHAEGFGLLKMHINPTDERQRFVQLSDKGKRVARKMEEMIYGETT